MQRASAREEISLEYFDISNLTDGQISAELSALQFQHKLFQRELGTLLPRKIQPDAIQIVLDLICSAGTWCIDFSKQYPNRQIYGVDMSERILTHTNEYLAPLHINNIHLRAARSLPLTMFADETFDLIHFVNGASLFPLVQWPAIMAELYRLLKPGGWLYLVDFEMGPVSTPALDRVLTILAQSMVRIGRSSSPNGMLPFNGCAFGPQRMAEQSFTEISYRLSPVNLGGWNNPAGRAYLTSHVVKPEIIMGYALATGVISSPEELQPLLREMLREIQQIGFCGVGMLISAIGRKPLVEFIQQ